MVSYLESICWTQSRPLASATRDTVNWNVLELSESRAGILMTWKKKIKLLIHLHQLMIEPESRIGNKSKIFLLYIWQQINWGVCWCEGVHGPKQDYDYHWLQGSNLGSCIADRGECIIYCTYTHISSCHEVSGFGYPGPLWSLT